MRYTCGNGPTVNVPERGFSQGTADSALPQRPLFGIFRAVWKEGPVGLVEVDEVNAEYRDAGRKRDFAGVPERRSGRNRPTVRLGGT